MGSEGEPGKPHRRAPSTLIVAMAACVVFILAASATLLVQLGDTNAVDGEVGGGAQDPSEGEDEGAVRRGADTGNRKFVEAPQAPGKEAPSPEAPPEEPSSPPEEPSDEETFEPPTDEKTADPGRGTEPAEASPSPEVSPDDETKDPDRTGPEQPSPSPSDEASPDKGSEDTDRPREQPESPTPTPSDEAIAPPGPPDETDPPVAPEEPDDGAAPSGPDDGGPAQGPGGALPLLDQPEGALASLFKGDESDRTELVGAVRDPTELSFSLEAIAESIALTALLVMLIGFPAELFNATLLENYEEISGWFNWSWIRRLRTWLSGLHGAIVAVSFAGLGAIIHSQLEADLGFDRGSLALFLGLFACFLMISLTYDVMRGGHLRRRHDLSSKLRAQLIGMVVAAIFVVISRIGDFHPGYMFGLFTALVFGWELHETHHGRALALASIRLFLVALIAWFLWIPVKHMAEEPGASFLILTLDAMLAVLWVAGIAAIVFGLAPIRFFYGETIKAWSFWGWLAIWVPGVFLFVYTLLHPERGLYGSSHEASLLSVMMLFIGFGLFSVMFWGYFRVRELRRKSPAAGAAAS